MKKLFFIVCIFSFVGCVEPKQAPAELSTSDEAPPTEELFFVNHQKEKGIVRQTRLLKSDGTVVKTKKCALDLSATAWADRDISCVVDSMEFDLFFAGIKLDYNVPKTNRCMYLTVSRPFFWQFQTNMSPSSATVSITKCNGRILSATSSNSEVNVDTTTGKVTCDYDHTSAGGPNCCENSFVLTTTSKTDEVDKTNCTDVSATTTVTSAENKFGGKATSCLGGPAMDGKKSADGWPKDDVYLLDQNASMLPFSLAPTAKAYMASSTDLNSGTLMIDSPLSKDFKSNLYVANAVDKSGGSGAIEITSFPPPFSGSLSPRMISLNPAYSWTCYDAAWEPQGRISVFVREWNLKSEFDKFLSGEDANPDLTLPADPIGPANDHGDWLDNGSSFPAKTL